MTKPSYLVITLLQIRTTTADMALLLFTMFLCMTLLPCLSVNHVQVFEEPVEKRFLQIEETIRLQTEQIKTLQNTV